jgi:hypothetical protein
VFGGVGSATFCIKVSVKASTDELINGKAPVMTGNPSGSRVSSTMTIDLLPVVNAISLVGRRPILSSNINEELVPELSNNSPGTLDPTGGGDR